MEVSGKKTENDFQLDEVRSLLQKSTRRRDFENVGRAANELLLPGEGRNRDFLTWALLYAQVFEDFCLLEHTQIDQIVRMREQAKRNKQQVMEAKQKVITQLLKHKSCGLATTMSVAAMDPLFAPVHFHVEPEEEDAKYYGLVEAKAGDVKHGWLLTEIAECWRKQIVDLLLPLLKLASCAVSVKLTEQGQAYLEDKGNLLLLLLKVLLDNTSEPSMREYLESLVKLATKFPGDCPKAMFFAPLVRLCFCCAPSPKSEREPSQIDWEKELFGDIPEYAVDATTERGRKDGRHLDMHYEEEAVLPAQFSSLRECADHVYRTSDHKKTVKQMSHVYWTNVRQDHPHLFYDQQVAKINRKRKAEDEVKPQKPSKFEKLGKQLPLLQMLVKRRYQCAVDPEKKHVLKGPFKQAKDANKLARVVFYSQALREVLGDVHTVAYEKSTLPEGIFLVSELVCSEEAKDKLEHIAEDVSHENCAVRHISPERLGLKRLSDLNHVLIKNVPHSVWASYLFRHALDVAGHSDLNNAVAVNGTHRVFLHVEDVKGNKAAGESKLTDLMFTKNPKKNLKNAIENRLSKCGPQLLEIFSAVDVETSAEALVDLSERLEFGGFDRHKFVTRMQNIVDKIGEHY